MTITLDIIACDKNPGKWVSFLPQINLKFSIL
jgi:hypothetical protein